MYWDSVPTTSRPEPNSSREQDTHRWIAYCAKKTQLSGQDSGSWTPAYWSIFK